MLDKRISNCLNNKIMLDKNALPVLSKDIISRKDDNGMLLFHVYTDEIYFIPFAAYDALLGKCNGSQTVQEIISTLPSEFITGDGRKRVDMFFNSLLEREIIQLW